MVRYINESLPKSQREGQIGINNQGLEMKIEKYNGSMDIDIRFIIDNQLIKSRTYQSFLLGTIRNENFPDPRFIDRTGERRQNTNGDWMEIIECYGDKNNIVRFDDDERLVEGVTWHCFDISSVSHPWRFTDSLLYNYPKIAEAIAIPENNLTLDDTAYMNCTVGDFYIKCLECGRVSRKKKKLSNLTNRGLSCEYCSDGISIPNKMLRQMDNQLDLGLQFEYSPEWLKVGNKKYSFDAYDDKLKIAIEMDANYKINNNHKGERKDIDDWKDMVSKEHGIKVIRVDLMDEKEYDKNTLEYIKLQLYNYLEKIYNLNKIDWDKAFIESQKSLMIETCRLWREENIYSTKEIGKMLNLNYNTISKYLKQGNKLGLCDYTPKKSHKEGCKKISSINNYRSKLYWIIKRNGEKYSDKPLCGSEIYNNGGKKGFLNIGKESFNKHIKPYNNIDIDRIEINNSSVKQLIEKLTPYNGWQFIPLSKEEKQQYLESINNQQPQ